MFCKFCFFLVSAILGSLLLCPALAAGVRAFVSVSSASVYQYPSDSARHLKVRRGTAVMVKDVKGGWAMISRKGVTGYMRTSTLSYAGSAKRTSWKRKVVAKEWFDGGDSVLSKGDYGYVYDIKSGLSIKVKRMGGHYHMDLEPAGTSDGKKLRQIGYSWDPRPAILYAGGKFIACSINTKPHGQQTIHDNDFDGQFCLHMAGSKTHGGDVVREDHQAAVGKAYRWAHKK